MVRRARRKAGVVKNEFGVRALLDQLEFDKGVDARFPTDFPPRLNEPVVRCELDVPSDNVPAEQREGAADFPTNRSRLLPIGHASLTELDDPIELFRVRQRFVNAFPTGFKHDLLVNRVSSVRNPIVVCKRASDRDANYGQKRCETQRKIAASKKFGCHKLSSLTADRCSSSFTSTSLTVSCANCALPVTIGRYRDYAPRLRSPGQTQMVLIQPGNLPQISFLS